MALVLVYTIYQGIQNWRNKRRIIKRIRKKKGVVRVVRTD